MERGERVGCSSYMRLNSYDVAGNEYILTTDQEKNRRKTDVDAGYGESVHR